MAGEPMPPTAVAPPEEPASPAGPPPSLPDARLAGIRDSAANKTSAIAPEPHASGRPSAGASVQQTTGWGRPPRQDLGRKHELGGEGDLSAGPEDRRACTDAVCLVAFVLHALAFWALVAASAPTANPYKLFSPRDFRGDYCGLVEQWDGGQNLGEFTDLAYSLNLAATVDVTVEAMVCSTTGQGVMNATEYAQACGAAAPASGQDAADLASSLDVYLDPSKAADLFTGSNAGPAMLQSVTAYFNMICTTNCTLGNESASRSFDYVPPPNAPWGPMWTKYRSSFPSLTLEAWSAEVCPYAERYCVPFPGITFYEGFNSMCLIQIGEDVEEAVGSVVASAYTSLSASGIVDGAKSSFGSDIGDLVRTWDVFAMVAMTTLSVGFVFLVLLRLFVKPLVWLTIVLVGVILVLGGAAAWCRSRQCADQGFLDFADQTTEQAQVIASSGEIYLNMTDCASQGGYAVVSTAARDSMEYIAYVCFALSAAWALLILFLCPRIELAIAVNQVAAQFVQHTPEVLLVPLVQSTMVVLWVPIWGLCAAVLLSQVSDASVPTEWFETELEAMGNASQPGACNSRWPEGYAWEDQVSCANVSAAGALPGGDVRACWKCAPPRFSLDARFGYAFFSFLWHNAMSIAVGQCIIAGAVGIWFFAPKGKKGSEPKMCKAARRALTYHLGSLAFGALVLAVVQFLRAVLYYLSKQAKAQHNRVVEVAFKAVGCCLWCFEKCVKFMNKQAYIQVALRGTGFCTSAKNAFFLIARNFVRFGALAALGAVVQRLGTVIIVVVTAATGYLALEALYPEVSPILPVSLYAMLGYVVAKSMMNVLALAVDTTLQCFITTEEMKYRGDFLPSSLKNFVRDRDAKHSMHGVCHHCHLCGR